MLLQKELARRYRQAKGTPPTGDKLLELLTAIAASGDGERSTGALLLLLSCLETVHKGGTR